MLVTKTSWGHSQPCRPSTRLPSWRSLIRMISPPPGLVSPGGISASRSAAVVRALASWVFPQPGLTSARRPEAVAARFSAGSAVHSVKSIRRRVVASKVQRAAWSPGPAPRRSSSAFSRAAGKRPSRCMLALVSTRMTRRRFLPGFGLRGVSVRMKGRAKASASRAKAAARSRRSSQFSIRLRWVRRGGSGWRNNKELKRVRSRVVRRIRWKITGAATARAPRRKRGARKFIAPPF